MATSNGVWLGIKDVPPLDGNGWEVKVLSYKDFKTVVAVIDEYKQLTISPELNDVGAGAITMSLEDDFWAHALWSGVGALDITSKPYLFQVLEDGAVRFEFIGARVKENFVNDDEERTVTIAGPGIAEVLKWAILLPPNFPKHKKAVHWYGKTPAMKFWYMILRAAQKRGTIPWVIPKFSHTRDTRGVLWADLKKPRLHQPEYGENLFDLLNIATGQDDEDPWNIRADWYTRPGFNLDVRQTFGAHLETKVVFFEGQIEEKIRERDREEVRNVVWVTDGVGGYTASTDATSIERFHRREMLDKKTIIKDDKSLGKKIADVILYQHKLESVEWTLKVPYDEPTRRVFRNYGIGDWIGVRRHMFGGQNVTDAHRVIGITVDVNEDGVEVELTLESYLDERMRKLARRMTKLLNRDPQHIKVPNGYKVPENVPMPVIWDPEDGFRADTQAKAGRMFVQTTDPALDPKNKVRPGDFWIKG